jgi:MerR family transcriptional regulator, thiopeptide resistance regulator
MEVSTMGLTVGQVARRAGLTVRTLHHYDEIGLLSPSGRTAAGYRSYAEPDLERLQRIMCYRQLGFALHDIHEILDDPTAQAIDHLRRQHELLTQRIADLQDMVAAVELQLEARLMGINLDPDELLEVFGDFNPAEHAEEVQERWGDTDTYAESQRRTSGYRKQDWLAIKAEGEDHLRRLVTAFKAGTSSAGTEAMDLAEEARQHIGRWFYDCSTEMHRGLGDLYVADARFTAYYDEHAPGLAAWFRDAIHANADRVDASD